MRLPGWDAAVRFKYRNDEPALGVGQLSGLLVVAAEI